MRHIYFVPHFKAFFAVVMILFGCHNSHSNIINVEISDAVIDNYSLFDFVDSVSVFELENTPQSHFLENSYYLPVFAPDRFYFLDRRGTGRILCFDTEGKWVNTFDKTGQKRGQYEQVSDIQYNEYDKTLDILDPSGRILQYNLDDSLSFNRELDFSKSNIAFHHFVPFSHDNYLLFSKSESKHLIKYSADSSTFTVFNYYLSPWIVYSPFFSSKSPFFSSVNGALGYYEGHNGQLYTIGADGTQLHKYLRICFKNHKFNVKRLPADKPAEYYFKLHKEISDQYPTPINFIRENSKNIFARVYYKKRLYSLVYNKESQTAHFFNKTAEKVSFYFDQIDDSVAYALIAPQSIDSYINSNIVDSAGFDCIKNVTNESNYFVIKYYLKK